MIANLDKIREFTVVVNGGTGCLVQPMSESEVYVLTAKHVIEDAARKKEPILVRRFVQGFDQPGYEELPFGALKAGVNYFTHPNLDAAILKIDSSNFGECFLVGGRNIHSVDQHYLCGYPDVRSKSNDSFRVDEISILNIRTDGLREARVDSNPTWEQVSGQSGGGIFSFQNGLAVLAGIQSETSEYEEDLGRIFFVPISAFEQIVDSNSGVLVPLLPHYMSCFSILKKGAMPLREYPIASELNVVRNYLQGLTSKIVELKHTPYGIKSKYGRKLLASESPESDLLTRGLWEAWLEFLIILFVCHEKEAGEMELDKKWSEFRLVFANCEGDWTRHLPKILGSDFTGLSKSGVVIVGTPERTNTFSLKNQIVKNIAGGLSDEDQRIDAADNLSLLSFRYVHLYGFQYKSIIENIAAYQTFSISQRKELHECLRSDFLHLLNATNN